ncbi:7234_t:CDS:1, partial [Funneliformis caledonium]
MPLIKSRNKKSFDVRDEFQMAVEDISSIRELLLRVFNLVKWIINVVLCKVIKLRIFGHSLDKIR